MTNKDLLINYNKEVNLKEDQMKADKCKGGCGGCGDGCCKKKPAKKDSAKKPVKKDSTKKPAPKKQKKS